MPGAAFRSIGGPQGVWASESQMDIMAAALGLDPVAFRMANLADKLHAHSQAGGSVLREALRALKARGVSAAELRGWFAELLIMPVFTAHPTESKRRTTQEILHRLTTEAASVLEEALDPEELESRRLRMLEELVLLWQSDEIRRDRPTVLTEAQPDLRSFIAQRLRWASKSRSYEDGQVTFRLAVVFLFSWAMVLDLLLAAWFGWPLAVLAAVVFLVKMAVDFRFLGEICRYFGRSDLMRNYLLSQCLHIAYILGIGTLANLTRRYEWKGRRLH